MAFDWLKRQNFREMRKRWQWLDDAVSSGGGGGGGGMPENPLAIAHGGHGGTTLAEAQENLEITPLPEASTTDAGKVYGIDTNGDIVLDYPPSELPAVTTTDNNKALIVVSGKWAKAEIPTEIPAHTATDAGKVVSIDASGDVVLTVPAAELPEVTAADKGKALLVDDAGEWTADSIPAELPTVTTADKSKVLQVATDGTWKAATLAGDVTPSKQTLTDMDSAASEFGGGVVTLTMAGKVGVLRFEGVAITANNLTFGTTGKAKISFDVPLTNSGYKFATDCNIQHSSIKLAEVATDTDSYLMGYKLTVNGADGTDKFACDIEFYKPNYALADTDLVKFGDEVAVVLEVEGA